MECLHGKPTSTSMTKNGLLWFCGQKPCCQFFCPDEDCYMFTKAVNAFRTSGCVHPVCSSHQKLATMRMVKDKINDSYGRPYFVCSDRERPCTFWQWGDIFESPRPLCLHSFTLFPIAMDMVVGIMDMDGFQIYRKFRCKELGIMKVGEPSAFSYFFDIGVPWSSLDNRDKKQCRYVQKYIHKLPFGVPTAAKASPIDHLRGIVMGFYERVKVHDSSVIAYKGGHFERDLLDSLGIPSVNLESFGCPKAVHLFGALNWMETCGNHIEPNAYQHCAKVEVEAFGKWLVGQRG